MHGEENNADQDIDGAWTISSKQWPSKTTRVILTKELKERIGKSTV